MAEVASGPNGPADAEGINNNNNNINPGVTVNRGGDPFTIPSTNSNTTPHRFSSFDTQLFALNHPSSSPAQAKKAIEAHLADTDRRIEEASKLGSALVQQRVNLTSRLREVDAQDEGSRIGPELRQKLIDIEREYNEVGRQSTRAQLGSKTDGELSNTPFALDGRNPASPTKFSSHVGLDSPSKANLPRKQRNQAAESKDIEFAAEITTSLLEKVRHLQAVLAERDEGLKRIGAEKARLEFEAEGFTQRLKHLDDSEQRYKDENWNLEMQLQDSKSSSREAGTRESKLQQALAASTAEKTAAQQELDEVRQRHGKLSDDLAFMKKSHESELVDLRRNYDMGENEKSMLERKVEDLTSQNHELARGFQSHLRAEQSSAPIDPDLARDDHMFELPDPEPSPPPSPTKGGHRNSALESETLKSSLNHAHRMIQNLKGNVNREKSEKAELKRLLQETRDELDIRRTEPSEKRKLRASQDGRKMPRTGLGATRQSRTDVIDDPLDDAEWEAANEASPHERRARELKPASGASSAVVPDMSDAYQTANETEDAFTTADERGTTDNDAFQTGAESMADESSEDLTETEDIGRGGTIRERKPAPMPIVNKANHRASMQSTASTSEDDDQNTQTPLHGPNQRFRLRMSQGNRRSRVASGNMDHQSDSTRDSPASFAQGDVGQSLAAELENMSGEEESTPSKYGVGTPRSTTSSRRINRSSQRASGSQPSTPGVRAASAIYTGPPPLPSVLMKDSGTMTEPWPPSADETNRTDPSASRFSGIWPATAAASLSNKIFGNSPSTPQNKTVVSEPTSGSDFESSGTGNDTGVSGSVDSTPLSTRSGASHAQSSEGALTDKTERQVLGGDDEEDLTITKPNALRQELSLSSIASVETIPVHAEVSNSGNSPLTTRSSGSQVQEAAAAGGILGSVFGWRKSATSSDPAKDEDVARKDINASELSGLPYGRTPLGDSSANTINKAVPGRAIRPPESMTRPQMDHGAQTIISSEQIDRLLSVRNSRPGEEMPVPVPMKPLTDIGAPSTMTPNAKGKVPEVRIPEGSSRDPLNKSLRRPSSAASTRSRVAQYPPLPPDHQEAIAAAASQRDSTQLMGPPPIPASAYANRSTRSRTSSRPQTPSQQVFASPSSKGGTTPRAGRYLAKSLRSRRSSVSSFASELDERFNLQHGVLMPDDFQGATDPRMIQAITQTMIGEMMWKYTRKAGRGEMSNTRHPRFFWVHPYTRTLYWSDRDPVAANRAELKSKSVAIEAVRVVTDDNPMPPGLHRKSIIVVTPGRSVKFTAQTSHRHETWFNALSYLLIRTGPDGNEINGDLTDADVQEFNPMNGYDRRSARSRVSIASFKSHATANRTAHSSIQARAPANSLANRPVEHPAPVQEDDEENRGPSLRKRISRSLSRNRSRPSSRMPEDGTSLNGADASHNVDTSRRGSMGKPLHASISSRISSYWKTPDNSAGNRNSVRSRSSFQAETVEEPGVLQGGRSVVSLNGTNDSAEDLRRVIEEREGRGDLENVRACCDGEHDVADLRNGGRVHHHHHSTSNRRGSAVK